VEQVLSGFFQLSRPPLALSLHAIRPAPRIIDHRLSPAVWPLHLIFTSILPIERFWPHTFLTPSRGSGVAFSHSWEDDSWYIPSTLPMLSGPLELTSIKGFFSATRRLLDLPNRLHFRKIAVARVSGADVNLYAFSGHDTRTGPWPRSALEKWQIRSAPDSRQVHGRGPMYHDHIVHPPPEILNRIVDYLHMRRTDCAHLLQIMGSPDAKSPLHSHPVSRPKTTHRTVEGYLPGPVQLSLTIHALSPSAAFRHVVYSRVNAFRWDDSRVSFVQPCGLSPNFMPFHLIHSELHLTPEASNSICSFSLLEGLGWVMLPRKIDTNGWDILFSLPKLTRSPRVVGERHQLFPALAV